MAVEVSGKPRSMTTLISTNSVFCGSEIFASIVIEEIY